MHGICGSGYVQARVISSRNLVLGFGCTLLSGVGLYLGTSFARASPFRLRRAPFFASRKMEVRGIEPLSPEFSNTASTSLSVLLISDGERETARFRHPSYLFVTVYIR